MRLKMRYLILLALIAVNNALEVTRLPSPISKEVFENAMGRSLANTCQVGFSLPIWEKTFVTESFCRCPDGGYGITCTEGFGNPCNYGETYQSAHPSLPSNYFIECSQYLPFLMKCAPGTEWHQELLTCDWVHGSYRNSASRARPAAPIESGYGSYVQSQPQLSQNQAINYNQAIAASAAAAPANYASSYGQSIPKTLAQQDTTQSSYGGYGSANVINTDSVAPVQQSSSYGGQQTLTDSSSSYGGYGQTQQIQQPVQKINYNNDISTLSQSSQSSYGGYGSVQAPAPVQVPAISQSNSYNTDQSTLTQSQSSYGGYGSVQTPAPAPIPVQTPLKQTNYNTDQSTLTQSSQSSYGGYGSAPAPAPAPVQVPAITQSNSYNTDQSTLAQSQSTSYGGYGSVQAPVEVPVQKPVQVSTDLSSLTQSSQSSYGGYGSANVAPSQDIQAPVQQSAYGSQQLTQTDSSYGGYGAADQKFQQLDQQSNLVNVQQQGLLTNSQGKLVQSFGKKSSQITIPQVQIPDSFSSVANNVVNSATQIVEQNQQLVPQEIDLKHPDNFISFFHKVIEPRIQAKNHPTISSTAPITSSAGVIGSTISGGEIQLLAPTVTTEQLSSTQQHFQFDIPFAKSSSADPNCKIPNGARVGIDFSFF